MLWVPRNHRRLTWDTNLYNSLTPIKANNKAVTATRASISVRDYIDLSTGYRALAPIAINERNYCRRKDKYGNIIEGIQTEYERTNYCLYSEAATGWTVGASTISGAAGVAPDGASTLVKLVEDDATATHSAYKALFAMVQNDACMLSYWIKAGSRNFALLRLYDSGTLASGTYVGVNLLTGAITDYGTDDAAKYTLDSYGVENYGNGFYRVFSVSTRTSAAAATTPRFYLMLSTDGIFANRSYDGDATAYPNGVYFWGMMASKNPTIEYLTSYIKTTSAAVTRSADSSVAYSAALNIGGEDLKSGTIVIDTLYPVFTPNVNIDLFRISDGGSANDQILFRIGTDGKINAITAASGGNPGAMVSASTICDNSIKRLLLSLRQNNMRLDVVDKKTGAIESSTDIQADLPDDLDQIDILTCSPGIISRPCFIADTFRGIVRN